tara:strand:- start:11667 stop:11936 length:270 start_codon:yes stop_codon:yes gene_type:complete
MSSLIGLLKDSIKSICGLKKTTLSSYRTENMSTTEKSVYNKKIEEERKKAGKSYLGHYRPREIVRQEQMREHLAKLHPEFRTDKEPVVS